MTGFKLLSLWRNSLRKWRVEKNRKFSIFYSNGPFTHRIMQRIKEVAPGPKSEMLRDPVGQVVITCKCPKPESEPLYLYSCILVYNKCCWQQLSVDLI